MGNRLPGMEDAQIEELEELARKYKKVQKKRMTALAEEVKLKDEIMGVMKGQKRKEYKYEDVEIKIVTTQEKIQVKIAKEDDGDDE